MFEYIVLVSFKCADYDHNKIYLSFIQEYS